MNDYKTPYRRHTDPEAAIVGPIAAIAAVAFFLLLWSGAA